MKRSRNILILGFALMVVGWLVYCLAGSSCVRVAYGASGDSRWLSHIPVRTDMSLEYNYARADELMATLFRALASVWLVGVVIHLLSAWRVDVKGLICGNVVAIAGVLLVLVAPVMLLKMIGALMLAWVYASSEPRVIGRGTGALGLLCVFALAFVAAPYWTVPGPAWLWPITLFGTCVLGGGWSRYASAEWSIGRLARPDVACVGLCGVALWGLHRKALHAGLPLAGDEDYHIKEVLHLCEATVPVWLLLVPLMALVIWGTANGRVSSRRNAAGIVLASCAMVAMGYLRLEGGMLRYPYLSRWFEALPVQLLSFQGRALYQEALFRFVPFLSLICFCGFLWATLGPLSRAWRVLAVLSLATLPILSNYASLLYLELPAIFLMLHVCCRAEQMMTSEPDEVRHEPAWISILLLGFIKETALPFMAAFIGMRFLWRVVKMHSMSALLAELQLVVLVCIPMFTFLVFRSSGDSFRGYVLRPRNLTNPELYTNLFSSWGSQFGLVIAFAGLGVICVAVKRQYAALSFWVAVLVLTTLFFVGEREEFLGYSRFNLYFLPPLIAAALWGFKVSGPAQWVLKAALPVLLLSNLYLSPVHADGARDRDWGEPLLSCSERSYPLRDVLDWAHDNHPDASMLMSGFDYPYYYYFYFNKYKWYPRIARIEPREVSNLKSYATHEAFDMIVVTPEAGDSLDGKHGMYTKVVEFSNSGYSVWVYMPTVRNVSPP